MQRATVVPWANTQQRVKWGYHIYIYIVDIFSSLYSMFVVSLLLCLLGSLVITLHISLHAIHSWTFVYINDAVNKLQLAWKCFCGWSHHFTFITDTFYVPSELVVLAVSHWPEPNVESMGFFQEKDEKQSIQQYRRAEGSIVPQQCHRLISCHTSLMLELVLKSPDQVLSAYMNIL